MSLLQWSKEQSFYTITPLTYPALVQDEQRQQVTRRYAGPRNYRNHRSVGSSAAPSDPAISTAVRSSDITASSRAVP